MASNHDYSNARMFYLTTGVLFNEAGNALELSLILDQVPCNDAGAGTMRPSMLVIHLEKLIEANVVFFSDLSTAINFQPASPHNFIAKMFQLTELVYKVIVANRRASSSIKGDIIATYQKCLGWYSEIFELVGNGSSRSPFFLFLQ